MRQCRVAGAAAGRAALISRRQFTAAPSFHGLALPVARRGPIPGLHSQHARPCLIVSCSSKYGSNHTDQVLVHSMFCGQGIYFYRIIEGFIDQAGQHTDSPLGGLFLDDPDGLKLNHTHMVSGRSSASHTLSDAYCFSLCSLHITHGEQG